MSMNDEQVDLCVVGMGYVGLTLATAFALRGLTVAGVERSEAITERINAGRAPFHEAGLDRAIAEVSARGRLRVVGLDEPLPAASAYAITVGTPLHDGRTSLADLESAVARVAAGMPDGALVILRSTVRIGTTRSVAMPILASSGKRFALAMCPERTIEGRALEELHSLPQVVGGIDRDSVESASALFSRLGVEIVTVGTVEAAELTKLASNTYRDMQFAFANELAYLADTLGIDVFDVIHAANFGYERMNVARPGPVAGPCLEKDAWILADSAQMFGTEAPLAVSIRRTNESLVGHVFSAVSGSFSPKTAAIVGLAFKGRPETSDVRGSMAETFASQLKRRWPGIRVLGWDPLVSDADARSIGVEPTTREAALQGDLVVIQTNHEQFGTADFGEAITAHARPRAVVVDLWNQLHASAYQRDDLRIRTLGRMNAGA